MFGEDQRWTEAARRLGFVLHDAAASGIGFHDGASFSHLKRAMGGPARPPFTSAHWMYGTRSVFSSGARAPRTVEVLVLVEVVSSGSSSTTYTHTLARIDPPLVVGMRLAHTGWLARKLAPTPNPFGDPAIDERVRLDARDPHRAMLLLASRGGPSPNIVRKLAALTDASICVCDSSVALYSSDGVVTSPDVLAGRIDHAVTIAAGITEQNAWLPPYTGHAMLEGIFRGFGDAHRFSFDPSRLRLEGEIAGARVRVALESEPGALFTSVVVDLPRSLGLGLRMKPQTSTQFIATFFGGQDIEIGDPIFDDRFVIQGAVPAHVQAALANGTLRQVLWQLAHGARDVRIDDARLYFRYPMPPTHESQLHGIVDRVSAAVEGFFPPGPVAGPYR